MWTNGCAAEVRLSSFHVHSAEFLKCRASFPVRASCVRSVSIAHTCITAARGTKKTGNPLSAYVETHLTFDIATMCVVVSINARPMSRICGTGKSNINSGKINGKKIYKAVCLTRVLKHTRTHTKQNQEIKSKTETQ